MWDKPEEPKEETVVVPEETPEPQPEPVVAAPAVFPWGQGGLIHGEPTYPKPVVVASPTPQVVALPESFELKSGHPAKE